MCAFLESEDIDRLPDWVRRAGTELLPPPLRKLTPFGGAKLECMLVHPMDRLRCIQQEGSISFLMKTFEDFDFAARSL